MPELSADAEPAAVVFDVGGVLIDWNPRYLYRRLLPDEAAVERFLAEVCTPDWNLELDRGGSWTEAVARLSARFPEHTELIAAFHERWQETVAGAIEDTVALLRCLRDRRLPLYALTNFSTEKFRETRERFRFFEWFDGIVVSADERLVKPDPRIYRVLLDRYRLDARATVYIDDLPANVDAARALGMTGLHFAGPARLRGDLARLGLLDGTG